MQQHRPEELKAFLAEWPMDLTSADALAPGDRARGEKARKGTYTDDWGSVFQVTDAGALFLEPILRFAARGLGPTSKEQTEA